MSLTRAQVVQGLLELYKSPRYLEVGVKGGGTLTAVAATTKVAVDPIFRFEVTKIQRSELDCTFHEVPSDEYFGSIIGRDEKFDVIFLDGLHTFEQTLRDFNNAVLHLTDSGVILLDDVQPTSHLAAIPDRVRFAELHRMLESKSAAWMGDVYRLVFFIDTFWQQLSYRTVAENHGQLIVWRGRRDTVPERRVEEIARMGYEDMLLARDRYLTTPFDEIVELVRASRQG